MGVVGIVLAGGRSSRMGTPKAHLEWHGVTLLRRTVGIVGRAVEGDVVVVRAPDQALPELPSDVEVVDDDQEGLGPMQGLAVGLRHAADRAALAFLCSTDLPFLHPRYVQGVLAGFDDDTDAVVPLARGHRQPLAAAYRTALAPTVAQLLSDGARKPAMVLDACRTRWLSEAELLADPALAAADPELTSVRNVNTPEDYTAALAEPLPQVTVERFGTLASGGQRGEQPVAAATLGAAATAVGITLDGHVVAALNGERITRDVTTPLVAGDRVAFLSADAGG